MADILSPFLLVYSDSDALAFMTFAAVLGTIRQNFLEGQPGIHTSIQHVGSVLRRKDRKLWKQIGLTLSCSTCSRSMSERYPVLCKSCKLDVLLPIVACLCTPQHECC